MPDLDAPKPMTPIRLKLEAAASSKQNVLDLLEMQAKQFFGSEQYRLDGEVAFEVETYVDTVQGQRASTRWAGYANYVNHREGRS